MNQIADQREPGPEMHDYCRCGKAKTFHAPGEHDFSTGLPPVSPPLPPIADQREPGPEMHHYCRCGKAKAFHAPGEHDFGTGRAPR